ncbi:MAG TPA: universal stress protein [Lacisediminihabitans sp.]|uniref:universal stress protein n=1 Tax=Lacisediminihabitans sp. TaxID=2787631 RepID=UPI002ED8FDE7
MKLSIFVGIDGSLPSRAAVAWAIRRAATTGSTLHLIHVVDDEWGAVSQDMLQEVHGAATQLVEGEVEFARSLDPSITIGTRLLWGDPMIELAEASADAGLLVVGTHKTGFLRGKAFGSRSLQLAAAAHSPVAIVPELSASSRRGIVVGVDDSAAGWAAVRFAAAEAGRTGQDLTLVRGWRLPSLHAESEDLAFDHEAHVHAAVERMMATALEIVKEISPETAVRSRSMRRTPAEALLDASVAADLLVVGSSRRHGIAQSALGPVSHDVLVNLGGPTIVVHGESKGSQSPSASPADNDLTLSATSDVSQNGSNA